MRWGRYRKGQALEGLGRVAEALRAYDQGLAIAPSSSQLLAVRARARVPARGREHACARSHVRARMCALSVHVAVARDDDYACAGRQENVFWQRRRRKRRLQLYRRRQPRLPPPRRRIRLAQLPLPRHCRLAPHLQQLASCRKTLTTPSRPPVQALTVTQPLRHPTANCCRAQLRPIAARCERGTVEQTGRRQEGEGGQGREGAQVGRRRWHTACIRQSPKSRSRCSCCETACKASTFRSCAPPSGLPQCQKRSICMAK